MTETQQKDGFIAPAGLAGVVVADTAIGDVRGAEGFFHYRQYDATELAEHRSIEDIWHLVLHGSLPGAAEHGLWQQQVQEALSSDAGIRDRLTAVLQACTGGDLMAGLRSGVSAYGALAGLRPLWDLDEQHRTADAMRVAGLLPWLAAAAYACGQGGRSPGRHGPNSATSAATCGRSPAVSRGSGRSAPWVVTSG